jgi:hypothetical protein
MEGNKFSFKGGRAKEIYKIWHLKNGLLFVDLCNLEGRGLQPVGHVEVLAAGRAAHPGKEQRLIHAAVVEPGLCRHART